MLLNLHSPHRVATGFILAIFAVVVILAFSAAATAQTTISTGSIQGTITDPSGAVVNGAQITITNKATGQVVRTKSSSSGTYSSGALQPGNYVVQVEAKGFKTLELPLTVQVAVTSPGNIRLELGQETQMVEVQVSGIQVNTEQATVQGVLTGDQIDKLPVNGRNFLDLAQLEPGVQMQDGQQFDPTKAGFSSVSINGVYGRTPRIEVDGLDVSDETVGTTTQNISMSAIQEFNISRSSLDLSTELTSSGAVNVATRSGTNSYHGQAFYNFRDKRAGFANFPAGQDLPFQRNQFGGRFGGRLIPNKLFFFIDGERTKQDSLAPLVVAAPFSSLSGGFASPFRDSSVIGRLDWQVTQKIRAFYKFTYNWNLSEGNFGYDYAVYNNRDNTPSHAVGVDFSEGNWSHSVRFGYLKFHNLIGDATASLPASQNPVPRVNIAFFDNALQTGPNLLAPQQTYQSNKQVKYDGSRVWRSHVFRFGVGVNRILGGGFAKFFGLAPLTFSQAAGGPVSGSASDPANYPIVFALLGNGQGYFTELKSFGNPAGGQADTRLQWYIGDSWKIKPNFTLTGGLRYGRDTGRQDSDLGVIPCSAIDTTFITGPLPCTGSTPLLDQFGNIPGLGKPIRQPNTNFGPQLGFAWDPMQNGKTVIRGGTGIYYENSIFNNVLFDRPPKLNQGLFFGDQNLNCFGASGPGSVSFQLPTGSVTSIDGLDLATQVCGQSFATAGNAVADLQAEYQAATASAGAALNANYVGRTLSFSIPGHGLAAYAPDYRTTRSYQMNIGVQRELWKGGVFSADYIRNVSTHFELTVDANHVGDARYLNATAALNAINATVTSAGCPAATGVGASSQSAISCYLGTVVGAGINDFAAKGLDSSLAFVGTGAPVSAIGLDPDHGAAFAGINPLMGQGEFQFPIGRSVYNGLQTAYKQNLGNPFRGVTGMSLQIAYTLSSFKGNGSDDQNFNPVAWDFRNPTKYFGSTLLDRKHQFKFGVTFEVAHHGPRISMGGGFSSAPPSTLRMQLPGGDNSAQTTQGEIFRTDFTGDGKVGDLFPPFGNPGAFGRDISASGLANAISNYNSTQAGTLTPAGQALVDAQLFTSSQLVALGAVKPLITVPPSNEVGNGIYRDLDFVFSWPVKLRESFIIEPSISLFNAFNFANFGTILDGHLSNGVGTAPTASAGFANGTPNDFNRDVARTGLGSGVFAAGAPRQIEFGLRLTF